MYFVGSTVLLLYLLKNKFTTIEQIEFTSCVGLNFVQTFFILKEAHIYDKITTLKISSSLETFFDASDLDNMKKMP